MKIKNQFFYAFFICVGLLLLLVLPSFIHGQNSVIRGRVTDENGQSVKDAKVVFHDTSRGLKFDLKSDKNGKFMKVGIPPSVYKVTVDKEGYFPFQSQSRVGFSAEEEMAVKLKKIPPRISEDKNLTQGIDAFSKGSYEEALVLFKKVIEKFPTSVEGYYNLGLTHLRMGNIPEATGAFERAIEIYPEGIESYLALGECYFNSGKNEEAERVFSQAMTMQPENPKPYYNLGIVYSKQGKSQEALNYFEQAIKLDPKHASACYQAALAAIRISDFPTAIKYFETFLELKPEAPEADQVKTMIEELKKRDS